MADPTYLDADTGEITEGDPWVCVQSTTAPNDVTPNFMWDSSTGQNDWSQYISMVAVWFVRSTANSAYDTLNCHYRQDGATYNYNNMNQVNYQNSSSVNSWFDGPNSLAWHAGYVSAGQSTTNQFSGGVLEIPCHWTGKHSTMLSQGTGALPTITSYSTGTQRGNQGEMDGLYFGLAGGNFKQHSRIDLYGILPKMILEGTL